MFGRYFAIAAVLSFPVLLTAARSAPAHGGGGHGGGGHMGGAHMGGAAHMGGMHVGGVGMRPPVAYNAGRAPVHYGNYGAARPGVVNNYNHVYYGGNTSRVYVNPGARGPYNLYRAPYSYAYGYGYPSYAGLYAMGGLGLGGFGLGAYAPLYGYAYNNYGGNGMTSYYPGTGIGPQQLQLAPGAIPPGQQPPAQAQQPVGAPQTGEIPADSASLRVLVPVADATILFDGSKTSQTGTERYFHTPSLKEGANASYRIRAMFRQDGKDRVLEQVVPVQPGQNITVDFTRPPDEALQPPAAK